MSKGFWPIMETDTCQYGVGWDSDGKHPYENRLFKMKNGKELFVEFEELSLDQVLQETAPFVKKGGENFTNLFLSWRKFIQERAAELSSNPTVCNECGGGGCTQCDGAGSWESASPVWQYTSVQESLGCKN